MRQSVRLEREGDVARIRLGGAGQGANDLQTALIAELDAALGEAQALSGLASVMIEGHWPATSIACMAQPVESTVLLGAAHRIGTSHVPVIAAFDGTISGPALALFLAANLRVARSGAYFSAPEFGLGMMAAGGIAVRLARRIGAFAAADFLISGRVLPAVMARDLGLCDLVSEDRHLLAPRPPAPSATEDPAGYLADVARFRARITPGPLAPVAQRLVEVLEAAALLPIGEAITFEEVASQDLLASELSTALRHVARARQQAAWLGTAAEPAEIAHRVSLWNQPDKLSLGLLRAGVALRLGASEPKRLEDSVSAIAAAQDEAVSAGRLEAAARDAAWNAFEPAVVLEELAPADMTIASPRPNEIATLRASADLGLLALEGVPPETNEIGVTRLPGIVEIHGGTARDLARLAAALRCGRDLVIHARDLGQCLEVAYIAAGERAVMAGAAPHAVDAALTGWGFAEGPFARLERRGLGAIIDRISGTPWHAGPYLNLLEIDAQLGDAEGDGSTPLQSHDEADLMALRQEAGAAQRPMPAREIVASVLAELALAGAIALQSGAAHRAGDIDLAAIAALGLARHRGGPMFQADATGLLTLRKRLRVLEQQGAPPSAPLLDVLIRNGRHFADLDSAAV